MMENIRSISLENRKEKRDERILKIIGYLKLYPGQTVYALQKQFGWPIGSIHSILKELTKDLHLKTETIVENNRKKILYSLRMEEDFVVDYFMAQTILIPFNLRAAKNSQRKGYNIKIEMPGGSVVHLSPEEPVEKFISENNITLDLQQ